MSVPAGIGSAAPGGATGASGQAAATNQAPQSSSGAAGASGASRNASPAGSVSHIKAARHITSVSSGQSAAGASSTSGSGPEVSPAQADPRVNRSLSRERGSSSSNGRASAAVKGAPSAPTVPKVTPTAVSNTSGTALSFQGLNDYQQRYVANNGNQFTITPPDQGLCVGNGFVLETVNDVMRIFNTSGGALTPPLALNQFLGYPPEINRQVSPPVYGPEPTDPSCYFDPQYQRWYHVVLTLEARPSTGALTLVNHLDLSVSDTSDPRNGWTQYHIDATDDGTNGTPSHKDCPCLGDYPHIGADANGFYITTNEYPWNGTTTGLFGNDFNGAQLYAMSKYQLAHTTPTLDVVHTGGFTLADGVTPAFTMWPAEAPGTAFDTRNNGTEWFLTTTATQETNNPNNGLSNNIGVWQLSNTASLDGITPNLALQSKTLNTESYGVPPPSEQKVGPVPLRDCIIINCLPGIGPNKSEVESAIDSNDSRIQQVWLQGGHLYGALDTIANVGGRFQAAIAYFVLNNPLHVSAAAVTKQGYLGVDGNVTYPTIVVANNGQGVMSMTLVGANYFPSAAYVTMGSGGPTGPVTVAGAGKGPDDEFCGYLAYNCAGTPSPGIRPRWGDYGAAAVDGANLWFANEYIAQTCTIDQYQADPHCNSTRATIGNWSTRISKLVTGG